MSAKKLPVTFVQSIAEQDERLFCDVCGQGIYGDFYVDKHYGITYCETCSSQQWLDETMASHNYRK